MAVNDNARLRQLVGDYYHGLISPESYREQRTQLLDNIGAQVDEQSDTITNQKIPSAKKSPPASGSAPARSGASASGASKGLIIVAAIIGFVIVGFVVATQVFEFDMAPGSGAEQEAPIPDSGLARGDAMIDEFLSRNDWSDDSLSNFLLAWGALDEGQRQLAAEGRRYRVLTNVLHRRIGEETALDAAPGAGRLDALKEFAVTMGAPYRESLAPAVDEIPQVEAVVEATKKPPVAETSADDVVSTSIEDVEDESALLVAEIPMVDEAEQAADAVEQPVGAVVPDPIAEQSASDGAAAPVDDPCPAELANTRRPYCQDVLSNGSKGPPLVVLQTGPFEMGNDSSDSESPKHRVEIGHHIAMSRFEVTADEYAEYCAATSLPCPDSAWSGDHPVVSVSWDDAVMYAEWLSEATGFRYRLPSEAEWEYAARGGTQTPYFFGDELTPSAALSRENGPVEAPVPKSDRTINRNPFRLYHMSGNVREWTLDSWYPNYEAAGSDGSARMNEVDALRVVRGGSYSDPGDRLRSAAREPLDRSHRDTMTGFRVIRELSAATP